MLQVAIVGMGNIGKTHARIYQEHPDTEVAAVVDAVEATAQAGGALLQVPYFTSVADFLARGIPVDMASVCTAGKENGGDHYAPTMELLRAGVPVLGEKPISNALPQAREMVALARDRNLRYGINLNHRFTPAAVRAKEWVTTGRLGEIHMINMTMWINNPNETSEHFHMRALHPHSLDVMRYFAGDVAQVQAFFKKGKGRAIWSNVQANLLFQNGVIGHLTGSYDAGGSYGLETLEVVGSEARFVLREACQRLEYYPRASMEKETYDYLGGMMAFPETFKSRITRWIEQNKAGAAPADIDASGEDALRVQTIIEGAIESWATGRIVAV